MKSKKFNLEELKVKSFITSPIITEKETHEIKGGTLNAGCTPAYETFINTALCKFVTNTCPFVETVGGTTTTISEATVVIASVILAAEIGYISYTFANAYITTITTDQAINTAGANCPTAYNYRTQCCQ